MKKTACLLLLTCFLFNHDHAFAQTDLTNLNIQELMNIEVTSAEKKPEKFFTTPAAVYVITAEDLRRSTATSIPELLRMVPGVSVQRVTPNSWDISIRGFNGSIFANKLLVLIDGRSVYTPLYGGVYWDVQDVPLEDIERIEVIRGSGGTLWGANAVNGVINIITKKPKDTKGGLASAITGSQDRFSTTLQYGARTGGWDYRVYGKDFYRDEGIDSSNIDDWDVARGGFRAQKGKWNIQGDFYQGDVGQQTTVYTFTSPYSKTVNEMQEVKGWNLLSRYEEESWSLQAYWDRTERYSVALGQRLDTINLDYTGRADLSDKNDLVWGSGYNLELEDDINTDEVQITKPSQTNQVFSTFMQDETKLMDDRLKFILGSKFEYNIFTHFEFQPNARVSYDFNEKNFLWAAVSRAVRTPSRIEEDSIISAFISPTGTQILGNHDITSEKMLSYELGYRNKPTESALLDLSLFFNKYDDLSTFTSGGDVVYHGLSFEPFTYVNGMTARTYGVELSAEEKIKEWWRIKGDYAYTKLNIHTNPAVSNLAALGTAIQNATPLNTAYVQSSFDLPKGFEFDGTLRYSDHVSGGAVPPYVELDLRLAWKFRGWEVALIGQNLLHPRHKENSGSTILQEVERGGYLKLTKKF